MLWSAVRACAAWCALLRGAVAPQRLDRRLDSPEEQYAGRPAWPVQFLVAAPAGPQRNIDEAQPAFGVCWHRFYPGAGRAWRPGSPLLPMAWA